MIPVIIILDDGSSFNYFKQIIIIDNNADDYKIKFCDGGYNITKRFNNVKLQDKVLELLHKEVRGCFDYKLEYSHNDIKETGIHSQREFQIYLADVIAKAKKELNINEL